MALPNLSRLRLEVEEDADDVVYEIEIPPEWGLDRSAVNGRLRVTGRGSNAFSVRAHSRERGFDVVVLVRPLDALIPNDDCESHTEEGWPNCVRLSTSEYKSEVANTETAVEQLQGDGIVPELLHHDILRGRTLNALPDAHPFYTESFGVEVWEAFEFTVEEYVNEFEVDADTFSERVFPHIKKIYDTLRVAGLHHFDLHLQNLMVNVVHETPEIAQMVVIDLGSVRRKRQAAPTDDDHWLKTMIMSEFAAADL
jgi:hypothetical protein